MAVSVLPMVQAQPQAPLRLAEGVAAHPLLLTEGWWRSAGWLSLMQSSQPSRRPPRLSSSRKCRCAVALPLVRCAYADAAELTVQQAVTQAEVGKELKADCCSCIDALHTEVHGSLPGQSHQG